MTSPITPGMQKVYDIGVGQYDVTVSIGPSYQSKRQEAVASQLELVKAFPQLGAIAADLIIRNMDWPGADEIADRVKRTLPPQVLAGEGHDKDSQLAQCQSQLTALTQQHELLVQQLNQATEEIRTKKTEQDGKFAIAKLQEETKIAVAEITTKTQEAKMRAEITLEVWRELHGSSHEIAMQAGQQQQDSALQAGQQQHEAGMAQQAQEAAQEQAQQQESPQGQ